MPPPHHRHPENNVILQPIKALKLAPGDTLVLHFAKKPDAAQLTDLRNQLAEGLWGHENKVIILHGSFNVGAKKKT